jgi:hypothetical protein
MRRGDASRGRIAWLDNDGVNLASGVLGLAIGAACAV